MSGRFQTGVPGQTLAPLVVRVANGQDEPLADVPLRFQVLPAPPRDELGMTGNDATLSLTEVTTDPQGLASTSATLASGTGGVIVECRLVDNRGFAGQTRPVRFELWTYPAATGSKQPLCLLSVNDFHMHFEPWGPPEQPLGGLARLATMLEAMRAANAAAGIATVVFNAGDDMENTLYHDEPGAFEALLLAWDRMGVDFWQVGNHDFHFGVPFLTDKISSVRGGFAPHHKGHPMIITWGNADASTLMGVAADYAQHFETGFDDPSGQRLYRQTAVLDTGGVRVGVLGVVTDAAVYTQVPGDPLFLKLLGAASPDAQGLTFLDPDPRESQYIGDAIDNLAARGAHIIIANSHAGLGFGDRVNIPPGKDEHIAREGLGEQSGRAVDVIISGHSHLRLDHAIFVDNPAGARTGIVQAAEGGAYVARADLLVDTATSEVEWIDSSLLQVDETTPEDPDAADMVASFTAAIDAHYPERKTPIAHAATYLGSKERTVCGMGQLINAAFLHAVAPLAASDEQFVTMVVPSTYRTDIHPGPVDPDLVYQVLSMHKMDAEGTNDDTIAYVRFKPGRYDIRFFEGDEALRENVTAAEYAIELVHSLGDVLSDIMPAAGGELSLDVIQLGGATYTLDATAPAFHRIVEGSVLLGETTPDPNVEYRLAGAHSIIATLAPVLDTFLHGDDPNTGVDVGPLLIGDAETGKSYTDTGIALWESLRDYLATEVGESQAIPEQLVAVTGESFHTVAPNLSITPSDIRFEPPTVTAGQTVTVTVRVRNLGETPVDTATVALLWETTPWVGTDDPDGFAPLEGLPTDHPHSRQAIAEKTTAVDAYPATAEVSFEWPVPAGLPAGAYPVEVRITDVSSSAIDPHTASPYVEHTEDDNRGEQRARAVEVE